MSESLQGAERTFEELRETSVEQPSLDIWVYDI